MDRPKEVVAFIRPWVKYANYLERELAVSKRENELLKDWVNNQLKEIADQAEILAKMVARERAEKGS